MHSENQKPLLPELMTKNQAVALTNKMLGSYPSTDLHDPETYIATMAAVLCRYPLDVGERAIESVVMSLKFIPVVAEIVEACRQQLPAPTWTDEWEARSRAQIEERQRLAAPPSKTEYERITDGFKQLRTYLRPDEANKENQFTPKKIKAKFGLTDAQWDAIPDAPPDSSFRKLQPPSWAGGHEHG